MALKNFFSFFFLALVFNRFPSLGSQNPVDSITQKILTCTEDTYRVQLLNELAMQLYISDPDSALKCWEKACSVSEEGLKTASGESKNVFLLSMAYAKGGLAYFMESSGQVNSAKIFLEECIDVFKKLKDRNGEAQTTNNLALIYMNDGDVEKSMEMFKVCEDIFTELKKAKDLSMVIQNQALIYKNTGRMNAAIELYNKTLAIRDSISDHYGLGYSWYELGIIHELQNDLRKSMDYFQKSLAIRKKINDIAGIAASTNEIGSLYFDFGLSDSALLYYNRAVHFWKKSRDMHGLAFTYTNLGDYYLKVLNFDSAIYYYNKGLDCRTDGRDKKGESLSYAKLGNAFLLKKEINKAIEYGLRAYAIGKKYGFTETWNKSSFLLSAAYKEKKDMSKAFDYFVEFKSSSDSLLNKETRRKTIEFQMNHDFERRQMLAEMEHQNEILKKENEMHRQKTIMVSVIFFLLISMLFSGLLYTRFRIIRKQKKEIAQKNLHLEHQQKEISLQKKQVEDKNTEILDSIHYAKRIQTSLLAPDRQLDKALKKYFLIYYPRDIVSGDFYWSFEKDGWAYLAVADCTGHGVSGAFLSLLGISLLNEIIIERNITSPETILDKLRESIVHRLNPEGNDDMKDGMEIALCKFHFGSGILEYASAKIKLLLARKGELKELAFDELSVGVDFIDVKPYRLHRVSIEPDDMIYAFTDGYADQMGGERNKKYRRKNLHLLLQSVSRLPVNEQKEKISDSFMKWKGSGEQTDDVTVTGIKI